MVLSVGELGQDAASTVTPQWYCCDDFYLANAYDWELL